LSYPSATPPPAVILSFPSSRFVSHRHGVVCGGRVIGRVAGLQAPPVDLWDLGLRSRLTADVVGSAAAPGPHRHWSGSRLWGAPSPLRQDDPRHRARPPERKGMWSKLERSASAGLKGDGATLKVPSAGGLVMRSTAAPTCPRTTGGSISVVPRGNAADSRTRPGTSSLLRATEPVPRSTFRGLALRGPQRSRGTHYPVCGPEDAPAAF
jgi:hypothetical protein